MNPDRPELMIVVGEASGDEHAAALYRELKKEIPDLTAFGLCGDALIRDGVDSVGHASSIAVVGLVEVLKVLRTAKHLFNKLLAETTRRKTQVAVLVDAPGFNLRLAKALHQRGIRVIYYISPQFWAWREGRVEAVRRYVDKILVLFPFEVDWYRARGVEAVHVGHPLVDAVPQLENAWDQNPTPKRFTIALMPGSRKSEVDRLLPELVRAVKLMSEHIEVECKVILAPNVDRARLARIFTDQALQVDWIDSGRYQAIVDSHLVLCASGTATLEVGLLGTPMFVVYKLNPLTHQIAQWVVKTRFVSLVNLVLDDEVVPEMLQEHAEASILSDQAVALLTDPSKVQEMRQRLSGLREALGSSGASARTAREVLSVMGEVDAEAG